MPKAPAYPVIFGKHRRIVSAPIGSLTTPRLFHLFIIQCETSL